MGGEWQMQINILPKDIWCHSGTRTANHAIDSPATYPLDRDTSILIKPVKAYINNPNNMLALIILHSLFYETTHRMRIKIGTSRWRRATSVNDASCKIGITHTGLPYTGLLFFYHICMENIIIMNDMIMFTKQNTCFKGQRQDAFMVIFGEWDWQARIFVSGGGWGFLHSLATFSSLKDRQYNWDRRD